VGTRCLVTRFRVSRRSSIGPTACFINSGKWPGSRTSVCRRDSGKQLLKIADFNHKEKRIAPLSTHTACYGPTQFVEANGIRFAYRRWGKRNGLPLVFNHHLNGNLDNWDPAVLDGLAKERAVIIFNMQASQVLPVEVPATFAGMAKNAEAFVDALGLKQIDLLGFSLGGMVAQQITSTVLN